MRSLEWLVQDAQPGRRPCAPLAPIALTLTWEGQEKASVSVHRLSLQGDCSSRSAFHHELARFSHEPAQTDSTSRARNKIQVLWLSQCVMPSRYSQRFVQKVLEASMVVPSEELRRRCNARAAGAWSWWKDSHPSDLWCCSGLRPFLTNCSINLQGRSLTTHI